MAVEIERKFLVGDAGWRESVVSQEGLRQGFLCVDPERTVRVRQTDREAHLTIKGLTEGASRMEFEYTIPLADATQLLDDLCLRPLIEKTRYRVAHGDHIWEVDVFTGDNAGLVIAEIELDHAAEEPALPPWLDLEVTGDPRYYNASLIHAPYGDWSGEKE